NFVDGTIGSGPVRHRKTGVVTSDEGPGHDQDERNAGSKDSEAVQPLVVRKFDSLKFVLQDKPPTNNSIRALRRAQVKASNRRILADARGLRGRLKGTLWTSRPDSRFRHGSRIHRVFHGVDDGVGKLRSAGVASDVAGQLAAIAIDLVNGV